MNSRTSVRSLLWIVPGALVLLMCLLHVIAGHNPYFDLHEPGTPTNSPPPPPPPPPPPCNPNKCPPDPNCKAGDPVYPANGKFYLQLTDYELPGELPITIRRQYSTMFTYSGFLGYGWNISYNERLFRLANGNLALRRDNDVTDEFTNSTPRVFRSPAGKYETMTENLDGTYTLQKTDSTIRVYNNEGTLARVENLKGNQLLFTYDPAGKWPISGISLYSQITNPIVIARDYRLTRIDQAKAGVPNGRFAMFSYNTDGRMTNIMLFSGGAQPLALSYQYASSGSGDLISYTDVKGTVFQYSYDNLHRMTNFPTGECACRLGRNTYDSNNRVTRQVLGNTIIDFEYLVAGSQTRVTSRIYDDQTLQLLRTQIEYFFFTASGKTSKHVVQMGLALDPANGESDDLVTTYRYSAATDGLVGVDEPAGAKRVLTYDSNGNMASEIITNGTEIITRVYQYDGSSRLTNHYVTSTLWPGVKFGQRASSFDANGRVVWEKRIGTNGTELVTTYQYQTVGDHEIATVTDPEGNRMARETDANGKLVREFDPANPPYQTRYQYDDRGNLTNRIDALGYQTQYAYDELRRVIREIGPLGRETLYTYSGPNLVWEEIGRVGAVAGRSYFHEYNSNNKRITTYRAANVTTNVWMRYGYDSEGNVIWEENALGMRATYTYDSADRQTIIEDIYGARTTNAFDKAGNLISVKNALGVETRMQYDGLNRLTNRVEAANTVLQRQTLYRLDPTGRPTQTVWADGSSTDYAYDEWGRLARVSGSREYPVSFQYDANNRRTVVVNGRGFATTNQFDAYGRVVAILYPDGSVERFGYDLAGNNTSRTDGNTNTVQLTFDALGRMTTESIPNSTAVLRAWTYNPWGQVTTISNALGGVESFAYDDLGRLTNTVNAAGLSLDYTYNALDDEIATSWPNGSYVSNTYHGERLTSTRDRAGARETFGYDVLGRRTLQVSSLGATNRFAYDALNRPVALTNGLGHVTSTAYDLFDQPVSITHPDMLVEFIQYDRFGRATNHYGAGRYPVLLEYDAVGNRTKLIDGNDNLLVFQYDSRNRAMRKTYADGSFEEFTYDRAGNLKSRRDGKGSVTTYTYDAGNRLERVDYASDPDIVFAYDVLGNRIRMEDGSGTNLWIYDHAGRVVTNRQSRADAAVAYAYDAGGNRTQLSLNGESTFYSYDTPGRLIGISNALGLFTYRWDSNTPFIRSLRYPNGVQVTNTYDVLGRLTYHGNLDPAGELISSFTYAYNAVNNRTNLTYADGSRRVYKQDSIRQLNSATGYLSGGAMDAEYFFAYGYDDVGNRVVATNSQTRIGYEVNNLNQYTRRTSDNPTRTNLPSYDLNGNTLSSGDSTYTWNEESRLAAVTNGTRHSEFVYNGLGLRVEKRDYANGLLVQTTRYVYDGFLPIGHFSDANQPVYTLTRGLDLSMTLDDATGVGGLLSIGTEHFYLNDGNGNIVGLVGPGNLMSAIYEYDPYGNTLKAIGTMADQPYRWSSKEQDLPSKLYYYGYRYYLADDGRFINRDPIMNVLETTYRSEPAMAHRLSLMVLQGQGKDLINEMAFVANAPVDHHDALGLACMRERFTAKHDFGKGLPLGPFRLKGSIESLTESTQCDTQCPDCSKGRTVEFKQTFRGSAILEIKIPTAIPVVYVRVWGGGSAGGSLSTKFDSCTGKWDKTGCGFIEARGGAAGCAGEPTDSGMGRVCLGADIALTKSWCADGKNQVCLSGGAFVEGCFFWRCYTWWFWRPQPRCW